MATKTASKVLKTIPPPTPPAQAFEMLVSVEQAKKWLENNKSNRVPRPQKIKRFAEAMKSGRWKRNTWECVKITPMGELIDGQHRLMALIQAGIPVYLNVVMGIDADVYDVLDTGTNRNPADVFKIAGVSNHTQMPSVINLYNTLRRGYGTPDDMHSASRADNDMLLEMYYERSDFWDWLSPIWQRNYKAFYKTLTPTTVGGIHALLHDIHPEQANEFMGLLCGGATLNQPILKVRNILGADKTAPKKLATRAKHAIIIHAWNMYRKNQNNLRKLKFSEGDEFPVAE